MKQANKKSLKRQPRKHIIIFAIIILAILATIIIANGLEHMTVSVNSDDIIISENVVKDLIETAKHEVPITNDQVSVSVEVTNEEIRIGEHTYPYFSFIMQSTTGQEIPILKKRIPVKIKRLFNESKIYVQKFVHQYFDNETSEQILNEMDNIKLVVGDFTISYATTQSSFIYENQKIYINPLIIKNCNNLPDELLIFTMVHEWLHMIRDVTNPGKTSTFLQGLLHEAMTDIIAKVIYPYERVDSNSYSDSYYYAYAFVSFFEDDALQSFFFNKSLPVDDKYLVAYAFIVQAMQDTVRPDGLSDKDAFLMLTNLEESIIRVDAIQLLKVN